MSDFDYYLEWEQVDGDWIRYTICSKYSTPINGLVRITTTIDNVVSKLEDDVARLNLGKKGYNA